MLSQTKREMGGKVWLTLHPPQSYLYILIAVLQSVSCGEDEGTALRGRCHKCDWELQVPQQGPDWEFPQTTGLECRLTQIIRYIPPLKLSVMLVFHLDQKETHCCHTLAAHSLIPCHTVGMACQVYHAAITIQNVSQISTTTNMTILLCKLIYSGYKSLFTHLQLYFTGYSLISNAIWRLRHTDEGCSDTRKLC